MSSTFFSTTFIRYGIAGGTAASLLFCILIILVAYFDVDPILSSAIAFITASLVNYSLQYFWAFKSTTSHLTAFIRYTSITLLMLGVNTLIFLILNTGMGIYYLMAQVTSTLVVFILNYSLNRSYTF